MVPKLKAIAEKILHHVTIIYHSGVSKPPNSISTSSTVESEDVDASTTEENAESHFDMPSASTDATFENVPFDDLPPLPDDFLFDPSFDWFSWGDGVL